MPHPQICSQVQIPHKLAIGVVRVLNLASGVKTTMLHLRKFNYGIMPTRLRGGKAWGSWPKNHGRSRDGASTGLARAMAPLMVEIFVKNPWLIFIFDL